MEKINIDIVDYLVQIKDRMLDGEENGDE